MSTSAQTLTKPMTAVKQATKVASKQIVRAVVEDKTPIKASKPKAVPKSKPDIVAAKVASKSKLAVESKPAKPKKLKLVRDSFTMPKLELNVLGDLKLRALGLQTQVKKSELLRAGIKALAAMNDSDFLAAVQAVPTLKTGRPKN